MIVILLGPPGAGKGTQARVMAEKYGFKHLSTGDALREECSNNTTVGRKAREYMDEGLLVPDDIIFEIIRKNISQHRDILLDGFPRNISQAVRLDSILKDISRKISYVFYLETDDKILIKRLTSRRVCPVCGKIYNIITLPSSRGSYCDIDGAELSQRDDDKTGVVKKRLAVYKTETHPLVEFYSEKELLYTIDGEKDIEALLMDISAIIDKGGSNGH